MELNPYYVLTALSGFVTLCTAISAIRKTSKDDVPITTKRRIVCSFGMLCMVAGGAVAGSGAFGMGMAEGHDQMSGMLLGSFVGGGVMLAVVGIILLNIGWDWDFQK